MTALATTDPFDAAVAFTFNEEGGLFDDPEVGITNLGIILADLKRVEGSTATADDVRALTRATATPIYRTLYWVPVNGGRLPLGVGLSVFDHAVNRGIRTSARILQRIVGATPDGWIGPKTLTAITVFCYHGAPAILDLLWAAQTADYKALGNATFERGWLNRCDARLAAAKVALSWRL